MAHVSSFFYATMGLTQIFFRVNQAKGTDHSLACWQQRGPVKAQNVCIELRLWRALAVTFTRRCSGTANNFLLRRKLDSSQFGIRRTPFDTACHAPRRVPVAELGRPALAALLFHRHVARRLRIGKLSIPTTIAGNCAPARWRRKT